MSLVRQVYLASILFQSVRLVPAWLFPFSSAFGGLSTPPLAVLAVVLLPRVGCRCG